jgi:hypothetical protein
MVVLLAIFACCMQILRPKDALSYSIRTSKFLMLLQKITLISAETTQFVTLLVISTETKCNAYRLERDLDVNKEQEII